MKKLFLGVIIVLVVLIVVVVMGVGLFLDSIVKKGMETVGPKITQVSIKVDAVNLSLLNGSARVKGLVVGNPEGYKTPQAISVGSAAVGVNPFRFFRTKSSCARCWWKRRKSLLKAASAATTSAKSWTT